GFDPVFGARPVKRALQRELQTLLAKAVLRGEFEEDDTVIVEASDPALTTKRAGDGNYSSGLVLRKGPRRQPEADESPNPIGAVKKDASEVACDSGAVPLHETPVTANGDHASTQDVEALQ
ncbi:ATP-dependent chaperone ClpB, partial [Haematococcus lacustris]